ncbi:hypothetical protein AAEO56_00215 [Flavobacterium sp. DGU11]|uniref:Uncharacterized protein n=1 Tax=Flavobacterium arundinis TaxID=3139143 RepID=A0ABU9HRS3_9FLAO
MDFRKPKTLLLSPLIVIAASFAVFLIDFIFLAGNGSVGTYGVNKTIGWAWQIGEIVSVFSIISFVLFVFGYILLWIVGLRVNKIISIVNLCILLFLPVVWAIEHLRDEYMFTFLTAAGVIISLIINTVFAILYKSKDKQGGR